MSAPSASPSGGTFRSLRVPNFRRYFIGQGLSQTGTWLQVVAMSLLVLEATGSGVALGLVPVAQFAPVLVLGPWAGLMADRFDRLRLLIGLNLVGTFSAGTLAMVVLSDSVNLWWAYGLTLSSGTVQALENPIRRALMSDLVSRGDVPNAVGLHSALMTSSRVVGPAIAGAVIAGPGLAWCFALNSSSYVPQLALFLRMDRRAYQTQVRVPSARGQLRAGFSYVWRTSELRVPMLVTAVVSVLALNYAVVLPLLATRSFGGSASTYTALFSVLSVGSLLGALGMARRSDADLTLLSRAAWLLGAATLAMALSPNVGVALVLAIPAGIGGIVVVSGANTIIQLHSDPAYRGRVLALLTVVMVGSNPIGGPLTGWLSERFDARVGLGIGGVGSILAGLGVTATGARSRRRGAAANG